MQIVFKSNLVEKAFSPEEQSGLQNILALINQMLQSGMAEAQQQPAPGPQGQQGAPGPQGQQGPRGVAMALEDDQQKFRMGQPAVNEGAGKPKMPKPGEESEDETKRGSPMKIGKAFTEPEQADGADGSGIVGAGKGDPTRGSAGDGTTEHEGTDAGDDVEGRISDIPNQDEDNVEGVQQGASVKGGSVGKAEIMRNLRTLAKAMGITPSRVAKALGINYQVLVEKSQTEALMQKVADLEQGMENLLRSVSGELGMRVPQRQVNKSVPIGSLDGSDENETRVIKELAARLNLGGGAEEGDATPRDLVRKDMPSLLHGVASLAGNMWPGHEQTRG